MTSVEAYETLHWVWILYRVSCWCAVFQSSKIDVVVANDERTRIVTPIGTYSRCAKSAQTNLSSSTAILLFLRSFSKASVTPTINTTIVDGSYLRCSLLVTAISHLSAITVIPFFCTLLRAFWHSGFASLLVSCSPCLIILCRHLIISLGNNI